MKRWLAFLLFLLCFLTLPLPHQAQSQGAETDAATNALRRLTKQNQDTYRIQASFVQTKRFSFLKNPVTSTGHFYFCKPSAGSSDPDLLWEYDTPIPSGLWYSKGRAWIWTQDRTTLHEAQPRESKFLTGMLRHMFKWFTPDADALVKEYTVTQIGEDGACLKFTARKKSPFTSLTACPDSEGKLTSLYFEEPQGDTTELQFKNIKKNGAALSSFPDSGRLP